MLAVAAVLILNAAVGAAPAAAAPPHTWDACDSAAAPAGQRCTRPRGLAADPDNGHIFVGDGGNARIVELSPWGGFLRAWGWDVVASGPGEDTSAPEDQFEVCVPADGDVCQTGVSGSGVGQFQNPSSVALDSAGNVYVYDPATHRVQKFSPSGQFLLMFGGDVNQGGGVPANPGDVCAAAHVANGDTCGAGSLGAGNGEFGAVDNFSTQLAITASDKVYVGDVGRIQRFDTSGAYQGQVTIAGETVQHLAVDSAGNLYIAYRGNFQGNKPDVVKIAPVDGPAGSTLATFKAANPHGLAVAENGEVYVFDAATIRIKHFNAAANELEAFGGGLGGQLDRPGRQRRHDRRRSGRLLRQSRNRLLL